MINWRLEAVFVACAVCKGALIGDEDMKTMDGDCLEGWSVCGMGDDLGCG